MNASSFHPRLWGPATTAAMLALLSIGCTTPAMLRYGTPLSQDPQMRQFVPLNSSYELLSSGTATACAVVQSTELPAMMMGRNDVSSLEGTALFQEAKYKAIEQVQGADNLMFMRVKSETKGAELCVTVTGRGYRLTRLDSRTNAQVTP